MQLLRKLKVCIETLTFIATRKDVTPKPGGSTIAILIYKYIVELKTDKQLIATIARSFFSLNIEAYKRMYRKMCKQDNNTLTIAGF